MRTDSREHALPNRSRVRTSSFVMSKASRVAWLVTMSNAAVDAYGEPLPPAASEE